MLFYSVVVFCLFAFFPQFIIYGKMLILFHYVFKMSWSEYPRIYLFIDFIS